ncbi:MAG TPA: hypothetical protein VLM79_00865 [Kofleriaceae bacterium]|nr:hypothetical protein [Kofleriaceae bacterium]
MAGLSADSASPTGGGSGGGGGGPTADPVPGRADDGGAGSLARRTLSANGGADAAFAYLVSDNDAVLDRNLADYGNVAEQRALLDGVIAQGADEMRVRRAFHAYWHVHLLAAGAGTKNVRDWPVQTLQAMHHQLKLLPDQDARNGAWKTLSLSDEGRKQGRGWYDETGNFSLGQDMRGATGRKMNDGYFEYVAGDHRAGATQVKVWGGERFKVGDKVVISRGEPAQEAATVSAVEGNLYTLGAALQRDHKHASVMELPSGGKRDVNWLDYTVRHEIAHSLDGKAVDTKGFYAKGGWATYDNFDGWVKAMGGESAWTTNDGSKIPDEDRVAIKGAIGSAALMRQTGSLFDRFRSDDPKTQHPIVKYEHKQVPVIVAAQTSMNMGDGFVHRPTELYAHDSKRFSISNMYGRFQVCNETAVSDRVSDYSLTAPAEFFADTYALFYEEAGKPGISDADHGRLIRNQDWRGWFREHVHDRGHGPAGTGAAKKGDGSLAEDREHGAHPGGASVGRASGNPGAEHG